MFLKSLRSLESLKKLELLNPSIGHGVGEGFLLAEKAGVDAGAHQHAAMGEDGHMAEGLGAELVEK